MLQTVRRLSDTQLDFKEDVTRWSIAENVEHLAIIDSLVLSHVQQLTASSIPERPKESKWKGRDDALLAEIRSREIRLKVPEWLLGTGAYCERHLAQIQEVMSAPGYEHLCTVQS